MVTTRDLEAFGDGWNRHDVDFLMTFMTDDCVFETTAGKEVCGTRYAGREQVREAFARVFKIFPDAHFGNARHSWRAIAASRSGSSRARRPTARRSRSRAATSSRSGTAGSPSRNRSSRTALSESLGAGAD